MLHTWDKDPDIHHCSGRAIQILVDNTNGPFYRIPGDSKSCQETDRHQYRKRIAPESRRESNGKERCAREMCKRARTLWPSRHLLRELSCRSFGLALHEFVARVLRLVRLPHIKSYCMNLSSEVQNGQNETNWGGRKSDENLVDTLYNSHVLKLSNVCDDPIPNATGSQHPSNFAQER